ncbi:MAG: helix-turn-helix domain-containing protein [Lachnospiraceae bacterium]|nr:helix-turn-helix domain-containing protein [Lachnospiraceae bacterium]
MIRRMRVMLVPNNKQKTKLFQYANVSRYAYNWALRKERENHKKGQESLSYSELLEQFMQLKEVKTYQWLTEIPEDITRQAIKEAVNAYQNFLSGASYCPRFKHKARSQPGFYQDKGRVQFTGTHIIIDDFFYDSLRNFGEEKEGRNRIKLAQRNKIPIVGPYEDIRFFYDGSSWYVAVGVMVQEDKGAKDKEGLKGDVCRKQEMLKKLKKLKKKKRRMQRSINRKYEKNKKGDTYYKTRNIIKKEKELQKLNCRLVNIQSAAGIG